MVFRSNLIFIPAFIGLLLCGTLSLRALDRYVVEPGTIADGNGGIYTSWSIAATQIQWAVNASTNASDTIWVSNGTYVLTNQITVISNIVLRSANGPNVTIVNGNFVLNAPDATTNNRCLYLSNASAFVSGFTFSNGAVCADGGGGALVGAGTLSNCTARENVCFNLINGTVASGGGVFLKPSGTVTACRVTGNIITNEGSVLFPGGGGIYASGAGCEIYGCFVSNNHIVGYTYSRGGGGVYAFGGARVRSSMICYNNIYSNITIEGLGGGVHLYEGPALLDSCTVTVNQALTGGGVYLNRGTVTNCLISNNYGRDMDSGAGGIYEYSSYFYYVNYVYNTTIINNTNSGVRMYTDNRGGTNHLINCTVENNTFYGVYIAGNSTSSVGFISNCIVRGNGGGGIRCRTLKNAQIRNCLIANNTNAGVYVGLLIGSGCGTVSVSSCTIVSNWTTNYGAGIRFETTNGNLVSVSSCIICSNGVGGTDDVYDAGAPTNYYALQYSCVGTNPGFTGAGIIVTNPQFVNFSGGNFRLAGNSPCINRGSNETWMTNAFDLDGRARIRYGTVDMGVFEAVRDGTVYHFR